ncbi:hypothetical protein WDV93_17245 [Pantoea ananatis]
MIIENVAQPMEIAHLPYRKGNSYEHYVGEAYRVKKGNKKWQARVFDVVEMLTTALQPDYVVLGGGNVDELDSLPAKVPERRQHTGIRGRISSLERSEINYLISTR